MHVYKDLLSLLTLQASKWNSEGLKKAAVNRAIKSRAY
jgi:hypothetical protein